MGKAVLLAGAFALLPVAATAGTTEDAQLWATLTASGRITGDVVGQIDLSLRGYIGTKGPTQTQLRASIGYRLSKAVTVSIGYTHIASYRPGLSDVVEERPHQQIAWTIGNIGRGTLSTRLRMEERFVRPGRAVGWRYRQQLRYQLPLKKDGPSLVLSAEPFFALNSTDWGARAGFDQLRTFVGVAIPLSAKATLETGYQAQYVKGATADRIDHIVPVTLTLKF